MNQLIGTIEMNEYGLSFYFGGLLLLGLGALHHFFYIFLIYLMIYVIIKRKIEKYQIYDNGISIIELNRFYFKKSRFINFNNIKTMYCFKDNEKSSYAPTNLKIKEIKGKTYIINDIDYRSSKDIINEVYKKYPRFEKSSYDDKQYQKLKSVIVVLLYGVILLIYIPSISYAGEHCHYRGVTFDSIRYMLIASTYVSLILAIVKKNFNTLNIITIIILLTICSSFFLTQYLYIFKVL